MKGRVSSFAEIARREHQEGRAPYTASLHRWHSYRHGFITTIIDGAAPADVTATELAKSLPYSWLEQQQRLVLAGTRWTIEPRARFSCCHTAQPVIRPTLVVPARDHGPVRSLENFQPFRTQIVFKQHKAGGVAARPRQTLDDTGADRIRGDHKHDWDGACRLEQPLYCQATSSQNDVWRERDQVWRVFANIVGIGFAPTIIDAHVAAIGPAQLRKPLNERRGAGPSSSADRSRNCWIRVRTSRDYFLPGKI